jgi:uncharacterized protein (DUF58 family)
VVVEEQVSRQGQEANGKPRREKPLRPAVLFPYLPAGQSRSSSYRGRLTERGRYRLGPLRVSTRFPLGLFNHTMTVGDEQTLLVFPRLGRLMRGWVQRHRQSFAGTNRREQRYGSDGDFYGVRQWAQGDSLGRIHWRTSARAGKLMTRQLEQPRNRDVALLLDLWQPEQTGRRDRENVELAVSFAATVVADLCRQGQSNIYLATRNGRAGGAGAKGGQSPAECAGGPASAALLQDLMEQLALIEGHNGDGAAELFAAALERTGSAAELVLVSTRAVDPSDPQWLAGLALDPARRAAVRRARVIDASSPELERYFKME